MYIVYIQLACHNGWHILVLVRLCMEVYIHNYTRQLNFFGGTIQLYPQRRAYRNIIIIVVL